MGCGAIKVSPEVQSLQATNERLKSELASAQRENAQKAKEIANLQMQQLNSAAKGGDALSTGELQEFLKIVAPEARKFVETAKKHGVRNTESMSNKIAELEKTTSDMKQSVDDYYKRVELQSGKLSAEAQDLQLEVTKLVKKLDLSSFLGKDLTALTSCEFKVVRAAKIRAWAGGPLPKCQELNAMLGSGSTQTVTVSLADLLTDSASLKKILVVSHRWIQSGNPDPEGKQLAVIKEHLKAHPEIEFVWMDWWCIPQGRRSEEEQDVFEKTLENIFILFLGAPVLLLLDMQYLGRFWTSYEAWLSMRCAGPDGLSPAIDAGGRFTIVCLGAAGVMEQSLKDTWGPISIEQAHENLSQEDIIVTNKRDKEQQLRVLKDLSKDLPALLSLLDQVNLGGAFQSLAWQNQAAYANVVRIQGNSAEIISNNYGPTGYLTFVATKPCTSWKIRVDGAPKYWFCLGVCKAEPHLNFMSVVYDENLCGAVVCGTDPKAHPGAYAGIPYGGKWESVSGALGHFRAGDEIEFKFEQNSGTLSIQGSRGQVDGIITAKGHPMRPCVCVHSGCQGMIFRLSGRGGVQQLALAPQKIEVSAWQNQAAYASVVRMQGNSAEIISNNYGPTGYVTFVATKPCRRWKIRVDGAPKYWFCLGVCKAEPHLNFMSFAYDENLCGALVCGTDPQAHPGSYAGIPYGGKWESVSGALGHFRAGDEIEFNFEQNSGKLSVQGSRGRVDGIIRAKGHPVRPCICVHQSCQGMIFRLFCLS